MVTPKQAARARRSIEAKVRAEPAYGVRCPDCGALDRMPCKPLAGQSFREHAKRTEEFHPGRIKAAQK